MKGYEPINAFLETQNIDKKQKIILQRDKVNNGQALRLFNGGEGIEHVLDPIDKIYYTGGLFVEKHWKKMYNTYVNDTISKFWKKEDFPQYSFILENKKGLLAYDFMIRYMNSRIEDVILISEPMFYMNKKYIIFYYNKASFFGDTKPQAIIMTKENGKWLVVRIMGDYIYYETRIYDYYAMKHLKKILILLLLSIISSCASKKYIEDYEPINVFLETQKLDKNRKYVLQSNKENNKQALRIFNGEEGSEHIIDSNDPIDYTGGLFVEKHWKRMYQTYANDTIEKYWKKEDFPQYNFILEKGTGLILKYDFLIKYMNTGIDEIIIISEPIYYMNKKYIMFYYEKTYFDSSRSSQVVIMKKEKNKWIIVKTIGDYIFS